MTCIKRREDADDDKPVGFAFKCIPGDSQGKGKAVLLTSAALKQANLMKMPKHTYEQVKLPGETVDFLEYNLSNADAMAAACAHALAIQAVGFTFYASSEQPNRIVKCFFKRRKVEQDSGQFSTTSSDIGPPAEPDPEPRPQPPKSKRAGRASWSAPRTCCGRSSR